MTWFNRLLSAVFPWMQKNNESSEQQSVPPGLRPEYRAKLVDPDIESRLREGMRVLFVFHSRSALRFAPDGWARGDYHLDSSQNRFSIEVEDRKGEVVAAVGWSIPADDSGLTAYTFGTFVSKKLRRRGLAQALWRAMIRECGRPRIRGVAATDEGFTLLTSMKEAFPDVVSFVGSQLDLRKQKRGAA